MKYPEISKRFEQILSQKGMTARELSEKSGVNETSISQYVNGRHVPSNVSSGKMAEILGVAPLWLMGYDVPMFPRKSEELAHTDMAMLTKYMRLAPRDQKIIDQMIDSMLEGK